MRRILLSVLAVVVVVAVAVDVWLWRDNRASATAVEEADTAVAVAADSVAALLSFDPASVRKDLATESALLTSDFRDDYVTLVTADVVPAAEKDQVRTEVTVTGAAVAEQSDDEITVLVLASFTTHSKKLADPALSGSRLLVTMRQDDDGWKISGLEPV